MSSTEQTALTVVGAVVGWVASGFNPMGALYGAQIGYSLGMTTLSTTLPGTEGPRLDDLRTQVTTYGWSIPKAWGTVAHYGAMIWTSGVIEDSQTERVESGGKGAPSQSQSHTTYSYRASFAIAFHDGEISAVRRIWANEHLVYDNGGVSDYGTLDTDALTNWTVTKAISLREDDGGLVIYNGSRTQEPDPTIQSYEGIEDTPAFRDTAYVVFTDLQLARFGNRIPQVKIEYIRVDSTVTTSDTEIKTIDISSVKQAGYFTGQMPAVNQDLTMHYFQPLYGGAVSGSDIAYCKVFPSGSISYERTVPLSTRKTRMGIYSTLPMILTIESISDTVGTLRIMSGSILGGDFVDQEFPLLSLGGINYADNGSRTSVNQIGSERAGSIGLWSSTNSYLVYDYEQRVDNFLVTPFAAMRYTPVGEFSLAVGTAIKSVALSESYVYSIDTNGDLIQYSHSGSTLNTWNVAADMGALSNDGEGLRVSPVDEDILYLWNVNEAFYKIDLRTGTPVVTRYAGSFSDNNLLSQGFQVWNGILTMIGQDDIKIYSLEDVDKAGEGLDTVVGELLEEAGLTSSEYDVTGLAGSTVSGFLKSKTSAPARSIEQLMKAFQFSCYEDDNKLIFTPRGGTVDHVIDEGELGAGIEAPTKDILPYERVNDQNLPRVVNVAFMDAALEYDNSSQSSQRTNIYDTSQVLNIELTLVLTGTQARQIAEKIHNSLWTARESFKKISLPLKYLDIVPTDIIQTTVGGVTHNIRVTGMNIGEYIELYGISESESDYSSIIEGENIPEEYRGSYSPGPTEIYMLDIPPLRNYDTDEGFYIAAHGFLPGWRGCTIYGATVTGGFAQMASVLEETVAGTVTSPMGDADSTVIDHKNTLTVRLKNGSLSSVTRDNLLSDKSVNAALVIDSDRRAYSGGAPARVEIFQFQNATDNGDGTFTLDTFIRGQNGTEWAMNDGEAGDWFLLLDATKLRRVYMPDTNTLYRFRHPSIGLTMQTSETKYFLNKGVGTRPFPPAHLKAKDNEDGTFTLTWIRRPRAYGEWEDGKEVPQIEQNLNYRVSAYYGGSEIVSEDVTTESATITARAGYQVRVAQVGSFYGEGIYFPETTAEAVVLEGTVLNDWFETLVLYFTMDDADTVDNTGSGGDKYLINRAERSVTPTELEGGVITGHEPSSTTGHINQALDFSSNPVGTGSPAAYIVLNEILSFSTGAISFWFEPDGVKTDCTIVGDLNQFIRFDTNGMHFNKSGTIGDATFTLPTSGWHHCVINKNGVNVEIFIDGVSVDTLTLTTSSPISIEYIGIPWIISSAYHNTWNFDEFRIFDTRTLTQIEILRLYGES